MNIPLAFALGTWVTVAATAKPVHPINANDPDNSGIITYTRMNKGLLEYSVNFSDWYAAKDITFLSAPTEESLKLLAQLCLDQDDTDESEDEDIFDTDDKSEHNAQRKRWFAKDRI